jgi:ABC-type transporter Mla MlaB component
LQDVARANSTALAFLLEGLEYAQRSGCRLRYTALPDTLQDLAEVSGLTPLINKVFI